PARDASFVSKRAASEADAMTMLKAFLPLFLAAALLAAPEDESRHSSSATSGAVAALLAAPSGFPADQIPITPIIPTPSATPQPCSGPLPNLTGTWAANDGGLYFVRQNADTLWWAGMSTESDRGLADFQFGLAFTNVFRGTIQGETITGTWVDVPRGMVLGAG